tara:strand:+ start:170 stop:811 length:642 start_codon:yes stop_codon:yes gene_type:complete
MLAKKRGRKPKNIIQNVNKDSKLDPTIDNNLVIRIKLNEKQSLDEILPGYCLNTEYDITDEPCSSEICWNCFHNIDKDLKSIPLFYESGRFYIYGYFCRLGCCMRYLSETFTDTELWAKYELFQLYCREMYGQNINLNIPPSKYTLKKFGGNLSIEEYRNYNSEYKEINIPIIIPIKNQYQNKNIINFKDNGDLKLFRRSKKEGTIITNMNSA